MLTPLRRLPSRRSRLATGAGAAMVAGVLTLQGLAAPEEPAAQRPIAAGRLDAKATVTEYCASCHNDRLATGGFSIEGLNPDDPGPHAESWEKAVRKLRLGMMPPPGVRRPDAATYEALITSLEQNLDAASATRRHPGRRVLHRLNRAEYANAVRDLLGLDVDVTAILPPDDAAYGFDNVADALGSSPALLQAYLTAARRISAVAVGDSRSGPSTVTYTVRQDLSQDHHLDGLPLGTVGGARFEHTFPADGHYELHVKLYRTNLSAIRGLEDPHRLEVTVDGERVLLESIGGPEDLVPLQKNPTDASDALERRLRVRVPVTAGRHTVAAAFFEEVPPLLEANRLQRFIRDFANPYDAEGAPHVQSIAIQGPFDVAGTGNPPSAQLFVCRPASAAEERPCAERILATLAGRAYRRPPSADEVSGLLSFYERGRADGTFESGIGFALRRVLASPEFVFRGEAEPRDVPAGGAYHVSDLELASRLSFFLWSSIPDDELLRVAQEGSLRRADVLVQQVRRMLADRRADALVTNFAGQWLHLRNLRGIVPNSDLYPDFDDNLRQAFRREAELFFASIVAEDRSVLELLTADYTFVNERLARHYGIPGVFGSHFRRVPLTHDARRGLLGKGAVLLVTSHANTTSPVLRGKWVLENVLGSPPPPPPPDVPALEDGASRQAPRTMRQQMEQHRASPGCAGCHRLMDPIGFALENFDPVGAWRTADESGALIEAGDVLANGERVDGVAGLREALVRRSDVFVQTLTEKLLIYALGRGLTAADMPTVRQIVRAAAGQRYRFSSLVLGIVESVPFQMRIASAPDGAQARAAGAGSAAAAREVAR